MLSTPYNGACYAPRKDALKRQVKAAAWRGFGFALCVARLGYKIFRCRRNVDVLIYKVDRLGDWLLAEPTIARIVADTRSKASTVVVWAGQESNALREWRRPDFEVETFALEPRGIEAKIRRAFAVVRLLAIYRIHTVICLRYSPEPIRDFVLEQVDARDIFALSWRIASGPLLEVPYEIARHYAILSSVGLAPPGMRDLLPIISRVESLSSARAILVPFGSTTIKDWKDESWCAIASDLGRRGLDMELWTSPEHASRAEILALKLARYAGDRSTIVKSGKLAELAAAVGSASLVIAVDTFTAHLAVAMDVPAICLIGGGQFGDFGPWCRSKRQRWITHPIPCFGCNWRCIRARIECMEDIEYQLVRDGIEATLDLDGE